MASIDDLKRRAKEALDTITDVSVEAYKVAEEKARLLARKAKLNADISRENTFIRRQRAEIGKIYYDLYKDSPDEPFRGCCEDITSAYGRIADMRSELEDIKNYKTANADDTNQDDGE